MEPRIQYAQTKDGVSIAFYTLGDGPPLVYTLNPLASIETQWQIPGMREWEEGLVEKRMLVRYDNRKVSPEGGEDPDSLLDAACLDLEAVVDRLGLERFALHASTTTGLVGIAYTARHPERVSHLVLWNSFARTTDVTGGPQAQALLQLANADWELFTETVAHVGLGWSAGEEARRYAAIIRESITQERLQASLAAPQPR